MRYITATERAIIAAPEGHWVFMFMRVTNYDSTWINLGNADIGSGTGDFLNTAQFTDDIDRNTLTVTASFKREIGNASLVPFRTDSILNVGDSPGYQPLLDLHRQWDAWICIKPRGEYPAGEGDFREFARGIVDRIDIAGDPATITVQGRGPEADMIDALIYDTPKTYAEGTLETVLQDMLDDQFGPAVYTLVVDPSAPSYFVNEWEQTEEVGFWDLFSRTAALSGAVVRFLYDDSDNLELTLFTPDRAGTIEEWQIGGGEYEKLDVGIDLSGIRNNGILKYQKTDGTIGTVMSPAGGLSASISRYGERTIIINLALVFDDADAQALIDAIIADLELPVMEQAIQGSGLWFGGLWDYVGTKRNNVHYDENQAGGITALSHTFQNGVLSSTFALRGKPAGRYATWLQLAAGTRPPTAATVPAVINVTATRREILSGANYVPAVFAVASVNDITLSVKFEFSDDLDFSSIIATNSVNVADLTADYGWAGSGFVDPGVTYYVRATPYSGVLSGSTPTGIDGTPVIATTATTPEPTDTATVQWDLSDPSMLKANVIGGAGVDVGALVGSLAIPTQLVNVTENDQWLELSTIPTAETEVGSEYRQQSYAVGVGSLRIGANIKAKTGTPTIGANYSLDGFATKPSLVSFTPGGTGVQYSGIVAMPGPAQADIGLTWSVGAGSDTAALDLYRVWVEYFPTTVSGSRIHTPAFAAAFN